MNMITYAARHGMALYDYVRVHTGHTKKISNVHLECFWLDAFFN